jgi:2-haloacid dehalogenase
MLWCMSRRWFLRLLGGSVLTSACAAPALSRRPAAGSRKPARVRAVAFDIFTLFDPRCVDRRVIDVMGDAALAGAWKTCLFEYCWIRAVSGEYADFDRLVHDSLRHVARARGVSLTSALEAELARVFVELDPWPDAVPALERFRQRGLALAPLANFSPPMIEALLARARMRDLFSAMISTDLARTYKPDPRAYALGEVVLGSPRSEIAFAAFGGWDAAGGRWFGYPTFWVNRLGVAPEVLVDADASGADLGALEAWIDRFGQL